ncbi:small nuclear ribonucleoprotein Sm D3 [Mortierella sp. GBA43]|nr:small nuclear ribonucleoprotein Sm D3 [Mortierella sp. GBA43]
MSIGVPIKLLHEAQGHIITIELKTGSVYRGTLFEAEDNMNVQLKDIQVTARDGRLTQLDQVYIRGSHIRFFIVPDMLKNAPMFKQQGAASMKGKGIGLGRGKATREVEEVEEADMDVAIEEAEEVVVETRNVGRDKYGWTSTWIGHAASSQSYPDNPSRVMDTLCTPNYAINPFATKLDSFSLLGWWKSGMR